ncbi:MAG: PIN domain nuclease [Natronosporangium sp.]
MALIGYLVDTSALARSRRNPQIQARLEQLGTQRLLLRCGITDLEVLHSAVSPADYERTRADLNSGLTDLPITPQIVGRALDVQRALARASQHRGVSLPDLIIAACAEVHGATVVHYDADYDRIAAVTGQPVEWVVPRGSAEPGSAADQ